MPSLFNDNVSATQHKILSDPEHGVKEEAIATYQDKFSILY